VRQAGLHKRGSQAQLDARHDERHRKQRYAAQRELGEETGLTTEYWQDLAYGYTFPVADKWRDLYAPDVTEIPEYTFLGELPGDAVPLIDPREHDAWRCATPGNGVALRKR
jgi:8-oxo-dGTP pyrophosphatase MutT (NUDIX family)